MRFRGGGVGHKSLWEFEESLRSTGWGTSWPCLADRDPEPDIDNAGSLDGDGDENVKDIEP